jgi:hypothetical protein
LCNREMKSSFGCLGFGLARFVAFGPCPFLYEHDSHLSSIVSLPPHLLDDLLCYLLGFVDQEETPNFSYD